MFLTPHTLLMKIRKCMNVTDHVQWIVSSEKDNIFECAHFNKCDQKK